MKLHQAWYKSFPDIKVNFDASSVPLIGDTQVYYLEIDHKPAQILELVGIAKTPTKAPTNLNYML